MSHHRIIVTVVLLCFILSEYLINADPKPLTVIRTDHGLNLNIFAEPDHDPFYFINRKPKQFYRRTTTEKPKLTDLMSKDYLPIVNDNKKLRIIKIEDHSKEDKFTSSLLETLLKFCEELKRKKSLKVHESQTVREYEPKHIEYKSKSIQDDTKPTKTETKHCENVKESHLECNKKCVCNNTEVEKTITKNNIIKVESSNEKYDNKPSIIIINDDDHESLKSNKETKSEFVDFVNDKNVDDQTVV